MMREHTQECREFTIGCTPAAELGGYGSGEYVVLLQFGVVLRCECVKLIQRGGALREAEAERLCQRGPVPRRIRSGHCCHDSLP